MEIKMKTITKENFAQEVLMSEGLILIDVYAAWCGPCNAMMPAIKKIAEDYNVGKMNMDENMEFCQKSNISAIPTLLFFKNGEEVYRHVGMQSEKEIRTKMQELS